MLAVFIILVTFSGGVLIVKEPILRLSHPLLAQPVTISQQEKYPTILSEIERQFREPHVIFLRFPRTGMNAFHLWLSDGSQVFIEPDSAKIVSQWRWHESFTATLFEMHTNLLVGGRGEIIVGYIGLALIFFVISGIFIWWPRRKNFNLRNTFPNKARFLLYSHYTLGILGAPFILWFAITGTTMVFHKPVTNIITSFLDSRPPILATEEVSDKNQEFKSWTEILGVINKTLPKGELQSWGPAKGDNKTFVFRKRMQEEWHPYGRTFILLDPYTAEVIQKIDARKQQIGMRIMEKIYPLHAIKVGGVIYRVISMIVAFVLLSLSIMGLVSFIQKFRP